MLDKLQYDLVLPIYLGMNVASMNIGDVNFFIGLEVGYSFDLVYPLVKRFAKSKLSEEDMDKFKNGKDLILTPNGINGKIAVGLSYNY